MMKLSKSLGWSEIWTAHISLCSKQECHWRCILPVQRQSRDKSMKFHVPAFTCFWIPYQRINQKGKWFRGGLGVQVHSQPLLISLFMKPIPFRDPQLFRETWARQCDWSFSVARCARCVWRKSLHRCKARCRRQQVWIWAKGVNEQRVATEKTCLWCVRIYFVM